MRRMLVLVLSLFTALAGAVSFAATDAGAALPHTQRIVVRPVHADGTPAAGYSVTRQSAADGVMCMDAASVAVDPNIDYCGASVTNTVACWKSSNHTVLCLRDPSRKHLVRIRYSGTFRQGAPVRYRSPQAVELFSGNYCIIRDGGAGGQVNGHPNWYWQYSCQGNAIYGPGRDGIDRSVNPWRVHVVNSPSSYVNRRVHLAYYVGTAS